MKGRTITIRPSHPPPSLRLWPHSLSLCLPWPNGIRLLFLSLGFLEKTKYAHTCSIAYTKQKEEDSATDFICTSILNSTISEYELIPRKRIFTGTFSILRHSLLKDTIINKKEFELLLFLCSSFEKFKS